MIALVCNPKRLPLLAAAVCLLAVLAGPAGPARAQAPVPDESRAEYMIKTTLVALNHANITGNYTVLRDLGSPRFRANNDAARLAAVFAPMREKALDLAPIVVFQPQLAAPASFDDGGRLRLVGQFPTRPLRVVFEIAYEPVGDRWLVSDISVNAVPWPEQGDGDGDSEGDGEGKEDAAQPATPRAKPSQ